jgi:imidazoleglycerol phosphate synthase glutamine amidotransferase subunit HisH
MALKAKGKRALQAAADHHKVFRHETLSARFEQGRPYMGWGQLPAEHEEILEGDLEREGQVFVVRSYSTPIGWLSRDFGWRVPAVKYSVTTSNHQSVLATAIANPSFYSSVRW